MGLSVILVTAVNAVVPVVLLILLGYLLKQKKFITKDFVKNGNKLVFNVCLPCMLFINVYSIESFRSIEWSIVIYGVIMLVVIFLLGLITAIAVTKVPERQGVILQCSFRSNIAIIGLSLAAALGGEGAMAVAAIISSFTVPVVNILAVIALSMFKKDGQNKTSIKSVLLGIAKNPLIIAVAIGMVFLGIRELQWALFGEVVFSFSRDLKFLYTAVNNLKNIATPFALLVLGGQFEFSAVKGLLKEIVAGTVWRIVLAPLLGLGVAALLSSRMGWGINEFPGLVALFGSPVAVSSAVMAGAMGSDEQLATQLVVWTSIFSIVTIFAEVCILMGAGLLAV
jgi:predicted permease